MALDFSGLSRRLPALLCFWALGIPAAAANSPDGYARIRSAEGITEYRLDNGLRVLLAPDDAQAVTAIDLAPELKRYDTDID